MSSNITSLIKSHKKSDSQCASGWYPNCRNAACHFFPRFRSPSILFKNFQSISCTVEWSPWRSLLRLLHHIPDSQKTLLCPWPCVSPRSFLTTPRGWGLLGPYPRGCTNLLIPPVLYQAWLSLPLSWAANGYTLLRDMDKVPIFPC